MPLRIQTLILIFTTWLLTFMYIQYNYMIKINGVCSDQTVKAKLLKLYSNN